MKTLANGERIRDANRSIFQRYFATICHVIFIVYNGFVLYEEWDLIMVFVSRQQAELVDCKLLQLDFSCLSKKPCYICLHDIIVRKSYVLDLARGCSSIIHYDRHTISIPST